MFSCLTSGEDAAGCGRQQRGGRGERQEGQRSPVSVGCGGRYVGRETSQVGGGNTRYGRQLFAAQRRWRVTATVAGIVFSAELCSLCQRTYMEHEGFERVTVSSHVRCLHCVEGKKKKEACLSLRVSGVVLV